MTEEFKKALKTVEEAEKVTYEKVEKAGIEKDKTLHNLSLKDALTKYGGWHTRTPAEFTAEFMQIGKQSRASLSKHNYYH